jgi:hypothetical protein
MAKIPSNAGLVSQSASGVALAHEQAANVDMAAGVAAGQISRDISSTANTIRKTIELNNYNKNVNISNSFIASGAAYYNNYRVRASQAQSLNEINNAKKEYDNNIIGLGKQTTKSQIPGMFKARVSKSVNSQITDAQVSYNNTTGKISATSQYGILLHNLHTMKTADITDKSGVADQLHSIHSLANNIHLTQNQRDKVLNIGDNIRSQQHDANNSPLQSLASDSDHHNDIAHSQSNGIDSTNRYYNNVLFGSMTPTQAVDYTMQHDKFMAIQKKQDESQGFFNQMANTKNMGVTIDRLMSLGGTGFKMSSPVHAQLKAGNGSMVVRAISPTAQKYYSNWEKAEAMPEGSTKDGQVASTWDLWKSYSKSVADSHGIPLSQMGTLPPQLVSSLSEVAKNKWENDSEQSIMGSLGNYDKMNGDNPTYGQGTYSNMASQYHFGNHGDVKHFGTFITSIIPSRQSEIGKEFSSSNHGTKINKDYINDTIIGKNYDKFKSISNITGTPISIIQGQFQTFSQSLMLHGNDPSQTLDVVNDTITGYLHNPKNNYGSNYSLPRGFFSDHGIANDDKSHAVDSILNVGLSSYISSYTKDHPDEKLTESDMTNLTDYMGDASDYHLISSNGGQLYGVSNTSDLKFPIPSTAVTVAHGHVKESKIGNKTSLFKNPYNNFISSGIWL